MNVTRQYVISCGGTNRSQLCRALCVLEHHDKYTMFSYSLQFKLQANQTSKIVVQDPAAFLAATAPAERHPASFFSACPSGRFMISCPRNGQRVIRRQLHAAALLLLLRHAPRLVDVLRRHSRQLGHPPPDVPAISVVVLALRSAGNEATAHPTNRMHGKDM